MLTAHYLLTLLLYLRVRQVDAQEPCRARCDRIFERTLQRISYDAEKVSVLFEKQKPQKTLRDVCWRSFDHLDCLRRCPQDKELEKYARDVRFRCRHALADTMSELKCIGRYHSFIQIKCSTFLKEASRRRQELPPDTTPDEETCRYLHLNSLCLENSVSTHCPKAKGIFRRLNFRDYFLNFIVPEDDSLFDDVDLDSCQIYDFVKQSQQTSSEIDLELTTIINQLEERHTTRVPLHLYFPTKSTAAQATTEKQEFTTLLNELLSSDEYEDSTETTTSAEMTTTEPSTSSIEISPLVDLLPDYESEDDQVTTTLPSMTLPTSEVLTRRPPTTTTTATTMTTKMSTAAATSTDSKTTTTITKTKTTTESERIIEFTDVDRGTLSTITNSRENEVYLVDETTQTPAATTEKKKLFSDDSMEDVPPNFYYSSARASHITTPRHYDIVTPVHLDTSTIFGIDYTYDEDPPIIVPWVPPTTPRTSTTTTSTTSAPSTSTSPGTSTEIGSTVFIPTTKKQKGKGRKKTTTMASTSTTSSESDETTIYPTPMLRVGVVVKPIRRWNEIEEDESDHRMKIDSKEDSFNKYIEQFEYMLESTTISPESSTESDDSTTTDVKIKESSGIPLSHGEVLLFIYFLLVAMILLVLIFILVFFICCRKKTQEPNKYEIQKF